MGRKQSDEEARKRIYRMAVLSLMVNMAYALWHGMTGMQTGTWWPRALGIYYGLLAAARFMTLLCRLWAEKQQSGRLEYRAAGGIGLLLFGLGLALIGVIYLSIRDGMAVCYDEIPMIAMAAYTFGKIAMAVRRAVAHRRDRSPLFAALCAIGYAEGAVSLLTLQRSMLVSFEGMTEKNILLMNSLTGLSVCLFIWLLGIAILKKAKKGSFENEENR